MEKETIARVGLMSSAAFFALSSFGISSQNPLIFLAGISGGLGSGFGSAGLFTVTNKEHKARREGFADGYKRGEIDSINATKKAVKEAEAKAYQDGLIAGNENSRAACLKQIKDDAERMEKYYIDKMDELNHKHKREMISSESLSNVAIEELKANHTEELNELKQAYQKQLDRLTLELKSWENKSASIESDLRTIQLFEIERARHEGHLSSLETELLDKERRIREYEIRFENYQIEINAEMRDNAASAYDRGYQVALQDCENELQTAKLKIAQLETRLQVKQRDDRLDNSLSEISGIIKADFKPVLISGGQGSGKGLATVALMNYYGAKNGCIPIVLDVGEGGNDAESTWYRAGIPSTNDPKVFIEILRDVVENMKTYTHRTSEDYKTKPPIMIVCDELQTVTMGLSNQLKAELQELLTACHTRGHKRKVFPIFLNQSYQIQNMGKILNGGQLSNFWQFLLNDSIQKYIEDNKEAVIDYELRQFMESCHGQYKAAVLTSKGLKPIKHPSHYRGTIGVGKPTRAIPVVELADPPKWLETSYSQLFIPETAIRKGASLVGANDNFGGANDGFWGANDGFGGADILGVAPMKSLPSGQHSEQASQKNIAEICEILGIDNESLDRFEDSVLAGIGKVKAAESLGISKGGNNKYKLACQLYELIKPCA